VARDLQAAGIAGADAEGNLPVTDSAQFKAAVDVFKQHGLISPDVTW